MNTECMCRVCETVHGLKNMFDEENEELLLMLRSVATVSITADDPLPKYICEHCSYRLQRAYDFRVQCELTDQKLREIILESKMNMAAIKIERVSTSSPKNNFIGALSRTEKPFQSFGNFKMNRAPVAEEPKDELEDFECSERISRALMKEEVEYVDADKYELLKEIDSDNIMIVAANEQTTTYIDTCENIRTGENEIVVIEGESVKFEDIIMEDYSGEGLMTDNDDSKTENTIIMNEKTEKEKDNDGVQSKDQLPMEQEKVESADGKTNTGLSGKKPRRRNRGNAPRPKKFQCNSCPEIFTEFRALNEHKRSHGARRFGCPVCGKKFKRRSAMRDHVQIHNGNKVQCHLCDRKCSNRGNLDRHIKQCHIRLKPYACHLCSTSFSRKANLRSHVLCHSDERNFDCDECDKKFKTTEHLKAHKLTHVPLEERKKKYYKRYNSRNYICPHCGKTSASLPTHIGHMKIHSEVKPFVCKYCPRTFHFKNSLIVHTFCHTGERPFPCDICGKRFRQSAHVKTHKACIHANHRPFKCQFCTKAFTHAGTLKVHERIHTGEKPYVCDVCDEAYADLKPLKKHREVVHSIIHKSNRPARLDAIKDGNENKELKSDASSGGSESEDEEEEEEEEEEKSNESENERDNAILYETPVEACKVEYIHEIVVDQLDVYMGGGNHLGRDESEVIPGVFKSIFYLHKHMKKVHPASNPLPLSKLATVKLKRVESFTCEYCNVVSASAAAHKQHLTLHADNKKYCCSVCSKQFQSKNYLKTHFRIHTGERPFKCKSCDKSFRQETHLAIHNQSMHAMQKPFSCRFCAKGFVVKTYLIQHEQMHHKNKRYECNICFLKFTEEKALAGHKQSEHADLLAEDKSKNSELGVEGEIENPEGGDENATSDIENSVEKIAEALIEEVLAESAGMECVEPDDDLPKHICAYCARKLTQAHAFKRQCQSTDKRLRKIFASKIEIITADPDEESFNEHAMDVKSNIINPTPVKDCSLMTGVIICDPLPTMGDAIIKCSSECFEEPEDEYEEVEVHFMEDDQINVGGQIVPKSEFEYETKQSIKIKDEESEGEEIQESKNSTYYILNDLPKTGPSVRTDLVGESMLECDDDEEVFEKFIIEEFDERNVFDDVREDSEIDFPEPERRQKKVFHKVTTEPPFDCPYCLSTFYTQKDLRAHNRQSHKQDRFQCHVCLKTFSRHYRLRDHMQTHGDPVKLPCSQCDKTYTNRGNLYRHIRHCHNKEKPHICDECGMSFARKSTLRVHQAVHSETRNFECEKCGKKFKTKYYLTVHKRSHVPKELRTYTRPKTKRKIQICICPQCGKKSNTLTLHLNHMRIHSNLKPHECEICSKKFTFKQTLKTHMMTHSGEKPYVCDTCGVSFRQIGHLRGHKLAVHSGLKQHKCQYCDKCFALRGNLTIHERLHTGERPFQCAICSRKFTDSNGLKRHKLTHVRSGVINNVDQKIPNDLGPVVKVEDATNLDQFDVSLDQLDVYLDELGNEYTEIIETETILETT